MRRLAWWVVIVAVAQGALACGRVLDDLDDDPRAPPVGLAPRLDGGPVDLPPSVDGPESDAASAHDARLDALPPPTCRTPFQDGFESAAWLQDRATTWPIAVDDGQFSLGTPARSGARALKFSTMSREQVVSLGRPISGPCPTTIDFWMQRTTSIGNAVTFLELSANGRRRTLRDLGGLVALHAEPAPLEVTPRTDQRSYVVSTWHHVVIRYDADGSMTVAVDDQSPMQIAATVGPLAPATEITIGILGGAGTSSNGNEIVFDDILIY
ncbi:MAG: hypothetical protein KF850_18495 [Labilithrix sp.]|nr:hypothetical protein [Labilithrix sp.]